MTAAWVCQGLPGAFAATQRSTQAIVRAIEARYQGSATLKATFLERYSQSRADIRVESGTVYFSRPGRMRWEYEAPEEKLFLGDGRNVWFYVPRDRTVTRAKLKESGDWRSPLALLAGAPRRLGRGALSRLCGRIELADAPAVATGNVVLRCLPKPADAAQPAFREILLEADVAYRLVRILIREPAGIETEFRFANWQENIPLPEVLFHFQPPPGVVILDEASLGELSPNSASGFHR
jgi:outer membrane lipoprotein carrier protein